MKIATRVLGPAFLIFLVSSFVSAQGDFKDCVPFISYEKRCKKAKKIRNPHVKTSMVFFQNVSDSVTVFIDGKKTFSAYIDRPTTVSSENTGVFFSHEFSSKFSFVKIIYLNSKRAISFGVDKKYPLYTIHFYANTERCFVSTRRCKLELK